jgi:hypothetical protein
LVRNVRNLRNAEIVWFTLHRSTCWRFWPWKAVETGRNNIIVIIRARISMTCHIFILASFHMYN